MGSDIEKRSGYARRGKKNRRVMRDRRKSDNKNWMLPERRSGKERREDEVRSGDERREDIIKGKISELPIVFRIRDVYFKVRDLEKSREFYKSLFGMEPYKSGNTQCKFKLGNSHFTLQLDRSHEHWSGTNCVPVFEFYDTEIMDYIKRAKELGAQVVIDALFDEKILSILFKDPFGNQFEISKMHDF